MKKNNFRKAHNKKSQITIFIIIGILMLMGIIFYFYVKNTSLQELKVGTEFGFKYFGKEFSLQNYVEGCVILVSAMPIKEIGLNGGTLSPNLANSIIYKDERYHYLCYESPNYNGCINGLLFREDMEKELQEDLKKRLSQCINTSIYKEKGYNVENLSIVVNVGIGLDELIIKVKYPIKISTTSSDQVGSQEQAEFTKVENYPLGRSFILANDIINQEIQEDHFDQLNWTVKNGGGIVINKHRVYPNIIYSLILPNSFSNNNYTFNFAIWGIDKVNFAGTPYFTVTNKSGCCKNLVDNICYKNSFESECNIKENSFYINNRECECPITTTNKGPKCNGNECFDCVSTYDPITNSNTGIPRKHGESWCVYDGPVGNGFDYVGSRHYRHYCFNGVESVEECQDFREEICAESSDASILNKAICKPNRWETCAMQRNKENCENDLLRDCKWADWLDNTKQNDKSKCFPLIPPGFRSWYLGGLNVCKVADETRYCDGISCPLVWDESTLQYCYFQGDCGNYRNVNDRISKYGFLNSDIIDKEQLMNYPKKGTVSDYLQYILHFNDYSQERDYVYLKDGLTKKSGDYILNIGNDYYQKKLLSGKEFNNPGNEYKDILNEAKSFMSYVKSIDKTALAMSCILKGEMEVHVLAVVLCLPFRSGVHDSDCEKCNDNFMKDCTEYKCYSSSQNCIYEYNDSGIGKCFQKIEDNIPPEIIFDDTSLPPGYSSTDTIFLNWQFNGKKISPRLKPEKKFRFSFNTTEPAQCHPALIPTENLTYILPFLNLGYSKDFKIQHDIDVTVLYSETVKEYLLKKTKATTVLQAIPFIDSFSNELDSYNKKLSETVSASQYIDTADFSKVLKIINNKIEEDKKFIKDLLIYIDQNKYPIFITCMDKGGNFNKEPFFVEVSFDEGSLSYLNTDIGPKIMKINPENGTILSISAEYANVQVFLNKKGYCKASIKDLLFDEMEFDSACVSDPDNRCDFILPLNNDYNDYFFKCAQMINPKTKNYYLKVEEADSLSVLNISIENIIKLNDPNTAIIPDYLLEQNGTIIGSMGELDLILQPIINFFNECSFSTTTSNFDEMNDKMNCANLTRNNILNNKFHCEGLFAANEEPYTIACKSNKNITIANRISKPYVLLKQ